MYEMTRVGYTFVFVASLLVSCSTAAARDTARTLSHGYQLDDGCHSLGYGKNCTDHAGCSACHWRLKIPKWDFCIRNTTAAHLPGFLFECCSQGDGPEPVPEPSPDPHAFEECVGLGKDGCDMDQGCVWCVSQAVTSQCYTKEQAMRLPAAVFECGSKQNDERKAPVVPF
jgi:hypothetical protein